MNEPRTRDQFARTAPPHPIALIALASIAVIHGSVCPHKARSVCPHLDNHTREAVHLRK